MAPERDELERRRRKRAALRKKQLMEQRRMRMRLMIAGVVMILVIALIFFVVRDIAQNHPEGESTPSQELVTEPPTQERATQPPDTPTTTIHIRAAGDLNVTDKVVAAGKTNYGDDYFDYTKAFLDVVPVLSKADLTLMNFEGNLVGPPTAPRPLRHPSSWWRPSGLPVWTSCRWPIPTPFTMASSA